MNYFKMAFFAMAALGIFTITSCGYLDSYQIKTPGNSKIEFILPPNTNLAFNSDSTLQHQYRYCRFEAKNLSANYVECIERINEATAIFKREEIKDEDKVSSLETISMSAKIAYNANGHSFVLQLNFEQLLKGDVKDNFQKLATDLLMHFSKNEVVKTRGSLWPTSICQDIVEKIFEMIPVPQEASLARYMARVTKTKSLALMNPKIYLLVDNTVKTKPKLNDPVSYWQFDLYGQTLIRFYRDTAGNIMQSPFLEFSRSKNLPDNYLLRTGLPKYSTLQSSTADIQLSESLKNKNFVFIYQDYFKNNNQQSEAGDCNNAENDNTKCNAQLLFSDRIDTTLINCLKLNSIASRCPEIMNSVFGFRNLITPVIPVIINNTSVTVPLNSTLRILRQQGIIPDLKTIKIKRLYKNMYKEIKSFNDNIILLPNDNLIF